VKIIDISQPVSSTTACFPGDTPFSRKVTLSLQEQHSVNLTSLTMSPHVGTHADSPSHIEGDMAGALGMVGTLALEPFAGRAMVIDLSPLQGAIEPSCVEEKLKSLPSMPQRLLFKTCRSIRYDIFEDSYAFFSVQLIETVARLGVRLVGIDTPSVDHIDSKDLKTHHALIAHKMSWLENLDLTNADAGEYFLVALPLKFMELEASPVRAVLFDAKDMLES
jgi:arylformamidase